MPFLEKVGSSARVLARSRTSASLPVMGNDGGRTGGKPAKLNFLLGLPVSRFSDTNLCSGLLLHFFPSSRFMPFLEKVGSCARVLARSRTSASLPVTILIGNDGGRTGGTISDCHGNRGVEIHQLPWPVRMGTELARACIKEDDFDFPTVPPGFSRYTPFKSKVENAERNLGYSVAPNLSQQEAHSKVESNHNDSRKIPRARKRRSQMDYGQSCDSNDASGYEQLDQKVTIKNSLPKGVIRGCPECKNCQKFIISCWYYQHNWSSHGNRGVEIHQLPWPGLGKIIKNDSRFLQLLDEPRFSQ